MPIKLKKRLRIHSYQAISRINSTDVIWRRSKGNVASSVIKKLQKEYNSLEQLISSGILVKQGVLDKQWVQTKFDRIRHGDSHDLIPVFRIIGVELWFKQWGIN